MTVFLDLFHMQVNGGGTFTICPFPDMDPVVRVSWRYITPLVLAAVLLLVELALWLRYDRCMGKSLFLQHRSIALSTASEALLDQDRSVVRRSDVGPPTAPSALVSDDGDDDSAQRRRLKVC